MEERGEEGGGGEEEIIKKKRRSGMKKKERERRKKINLTAEDHQKKYRCNQIPVKTLSKFPNITV